jgi:hypothetical protein
MAHNKSTRVSSLVAFGLLALSRTTWNMILPYIDATVASSTGINVLLQRHWILQQLSPQVDEIPLRHRSLDTAGTSIKDLAWTARLSSRGSSQTNNHCFLRRFFLVLGKVHSACPITLHHSRHTRHQEQRSIRHHRGLRIMDE